MPRKKSENEVLASFNVCVQCSCGKIIRLSGRKEENDEIKGRVSFMQVVEDQGMIGLDMFKHKM